MRTRKGILAVLLVAGGLALGGMGTSFGARVVEKPPVPGFTQGGSRGESHDWNLGPTGARGWVYGWKAQTSEARQILATAVAKGSPADGILENGDVILGVGGKAFGDDARIQFARAITAAEAEQGGGVLRLIRWRDGKTQDVELKLPVMGTCSDTAPYNCQKSRAACRSTCSGALRAPFILFRLAGTLALHDTQEL